MPAPLGAPESGRVEAPARGHRPPLELDLLLPIHGAPAALARCLASLERHTDLSRHRLLLLPDGPQEREVESLLSDFGGRGLATVVRCPERRGFVATANRGFRQSNDRDVVLLNSDIRVPAGWLERILEAARSVERVATVTPFTNFGSICSLPRWLEENRLPVGHDVDSLAALVERVSLRLRPQLPTAVGFCCFLSRAAIAEVGEFDEKTFGLGYGEEVDFCLRATARGFVHLLDDATFVYHEGQGSFSAASVRQNAGAQRALLRKHPGFERDVTHFLRADPLAAARAPILEALIPRRPAAPSKPARVLHVVHGWPPWNHAGTEIYAQRLVRRQASAREVTVLARVDEPRRATGQAIESLEEGARVRLLVNHFDQRDPRARNSLRNPRAERELETVLDEVRPDLAHLHHLAGLGLSLAPRIARRGIPVLFQLQDWWSLCARANLLDADRRLCPGPSPGRCSRCLPLTAVPGAAIANRALYLLRRRLARRALAAASAIVAGSRAVVESHRRAGLLPEGIAVHVLDYGVDAVPERVRRATPRLPLRFGFIGSLLPHKGLHLAAAAMSGLRPDQASLAIWGDEKHSPAYVEEVRRSAGAGELHWRGTFEEAERDRVWSEIDLLLAPSLGLESYGLVVEEAIARGVPVLASDRGALPDRLREGGGKLFDPAQPGTLAAELHALVDEPARLDGWRTSRPVRSEEAHAAEIEAIYRDLVHLDVAGRKP